MIHYESFKPTEFDNHFPLKDRETWLVAPVSHNRDSDCLEESNFYSFLTMMGGESDAMEIIRFGHWPGWFEIILIDPSDASTLKRASELEASLENYPVLDDEDFCNREHNQYLENWETAQRDFVQGLVKQFNLSSNAEDLLGNIPEDELRYFFESLIPSGDFYEFSNYWPRIDLAFTNCNRSYLGSFLKTLHSSPR